MYNGKYAHVPLLDVMNVLIHYMDEKSARKMESDLHPGKSFVSSCDKAYYLYEKAMDGTLQKPVIW